MIKTGPSQAFQIRYFASTNKGLKRRKNEDAYRVVSTIPQHGALIDRGTMIFIVADGMGGQPCGEVASEIACKGMEDFIYTANGSPEMIKEQLIERFHDIDNDIRDYTNKDPFCRDMGTTLSAVVLSGDTAIIAHVGDCRIYLYRDTELTPLTVDHTFVQEMVELGLIKPEEAFSHPYRHQLTQAVGTSEPLDQIDTRIVPLSAKDRLLLSSDGLHDVVSYAAIKQAMEQTKSPEQAVNMLQSAALRLGGPDNVTVIAIDLIACRQ